MQLKSKSEINILSAEFLENKALYPSVIHCCYYGCFQLMKYRLCHDFNLGYEDINSKVQSSKMSEHTCVRNEFVSKIKNTIDKRNFDNLVKDLYTFRVQSDYKPIQIGCTDSKNARSKADEIITIIKNTHND